MSGAHGHNGGALMRMVYDGVGRTAYCDEGYVGHRHGGLILIMK